jgi:hypothetical protein
MLDSIIEAPGKPLSRSEAGGAFTELATLANEVDQRVREGRFQRWVALVAGFSGALSGLEVTYEHYRGSYNQRIMYTPVILSGLLTISGLAAFRSRRVARTVLPVVSSITLIDSLIGTFFHVRGIHRKPGGWRLPIVNIVMGPPLFAPLLFGTSGYLGLMASFLRRDDGNQAPSLPMPAHPRHALGKILGGSDKIGWQQDLREGRFQKHMAVVTAMSAFFSAFEAAYSHYKSNFRFKAQWTPVIIAPSVMIASIAAVKSEKVARTVLPASSLLAMLDGAVGFVYHSRGVIRRPGGWRMAFYNVIYGPPVFAPLLLAAAGFMGVLTSLLRRERD